MSHLESIRRALEISGIDTTAVNMVILPEKGGEGAQIHLVIKRSDGHVNLCEMKFHSSEVNIDQKENLKLRNRKDVFRQRYKVRGTVFLTLEDLFQNL